MLGRITLVVLGVLVLGGAIGFALTRGGDDRRAARPGAALVWAVGDGGDGSRAAGIVADRIADELPDRVLYLGDVYESGTREDFERKVRAPYGALLRRMEPTPGNHEWPRRAEGYDPFWREQKGRRMPYHYAFSIAGWRIISLNSEDPANPEQLAFLRGEVSRLRGNCAIAFWHRPRFNAGEHREEEADVQPLWLEVQGRVPIVLSGHDHNLQRFRPAGGTTQFVVGAGGRERYAVNDGDERLAFSRDDIDGGLRMELSPGVARLSFVAATGDELDRTTTRCRRGD